MAKKSAAPATMELVHRKPAELKNHPLNIQIYGGHIDDHFLESIRQHGIQAPLTICKSSNSDLHDFVVQGRRRRMAAVMLDIATVPCVVWECDDTLDFERRMLVDNIRNETTVEERVRMYEELKRIEAGLAEQRMKATLKRGQSSAAGNSRSGENKAFSDETDEKPRSQRAKDIAAAEVDLSPKTADTGVRVIHTADALRAAGDIAKADEIIAAVNTKRMAAAARIAAEATAPPKTGPTDGQLQSRDIDRHATKLVASVAAAVKAAEEMMKAIDTKCRDCEPMRSRKKKFETQLHKMRDMLDPCEHHAGLIAKSWSDTKGQVDQ